MKSQNLISKKRPVFTRRICRTLAVSLAICAGILCIACSPTPETPPISSESSQPSQETQKPQPTPENTGSIAGAQTSEPEEQIAQEQTHDQIPDELIPEIDETDEQSPELTSPYVKITEQDIEDALYSTGDIAKTLSVFAEGEGVYYRWYVNDRAQNYGGKLISGATSKTFVPSTDKVGEAYYYCVAYSLQNDEQTHDASEVAFIRTANITPVITSQPSDVVISSSTPQYFSTVAHSVGELSYQWYNSSGKISGATNSAYTPTLPMNIESYYCVITAKYDGQTRHVTSETAYAGDMNVSVSGNEFSYAYIQNVTAKPLSVQAEGMGDFTYQWYVNTTFGYEGGQVISGATNSTYSPPTNSYGTSYYFCEIKQTVLGHTGTVNSKICSVSVGY